MNVTELSIKNHITTLILYALIIVAGVMSYGSIEKGEDPPYQIKTAVISTMWPGATAMQMAELVSDPIEEIVQDIEELKFVETKNLPGMATTYVQIEAKYRDLAPIWEKVRKKMQYEAAPKMPSGVIGPIVNDEFGDVFGTVIMVTADGYSSRELANIANDLRDQILKKVDEAGKVHLYGVQDERVYINFDNSKIAAMGLTPTDIISSINSRNKVIDAGSIKISNDRMNVTATGDYLSVEEIGSTVINIPGSNEILYLRDIASIERGYVDPATYITRFNGQEAVAVAVSLKDGADDTKLGKNVAELITRYEETYPIGVNFDFIAYSPRRVLDKVNSFVSNLAQSIVTVLAVMFIALGFRTGLIVASLIPTSIALTFVIMPKFGVNLDQISLAGLIIALGMLVDNAIVMAESIMVELENGKSRWDACVQSATSLKIPLLISSLTTVAAFSPIFLIEEAVGEYLGPMSKVVVITLLSSWVIAMTLIPLLCYLFLKVDVKEESYNTKLYSLYRAGLIKVLKYKFISALAALGLFIFGMLLFGLTEKQFMPDSDQVIMRTTVRLPKGSDIKSTEGVIKILDQYVAENYQVEDKQVPVGFFTNMFSGGTARKYEKNGVLNWGSFIGGGAPRYILAYGPEARLPEYAYLLYNVTNYEIIEEMALDIDTYVKDKFPGIEIVSDIMGGGVSTEKPIEYRLSGDNLEDLFSKVEEVKNKLRTIPEAKEITDNWKLPIRKLSIEVDQEKVRQSGLNSEEVGQGLEAILGGLNIGVYREPIGDAIKKSIPIVLRTTEAYREDVEKLETVKIHSRATGESVPLSQIAKITLDHEYGLVYKRDRIYTIIVQAELVGEATANEVNKIMVPWLQDKMEEWESEKGGKVRKIGSTFQNREGTFYKFEIGGEMESSSDSQASLASKLPAAGLIMFLLLVAQFNSIKKPIIIFLTIPLGILGVSIGLLVTGYPFGFTPLIALVSLSGIVVNNAIVLLDQIDVEVNENGLPQTHAIVVAAQKRLRPILLTTATTLCGLIPLWLFGGKLFESMAVSLIFGLVFATLLTLGVIPALFSIFFKINFKKYDYEKGE